MTQPLTDDEIRTLILITDQYQAAQIRAQVARELNEQYQAQLRRKYGLDDSWLCTDALAGFQKAGDDGDNDN